MRPLKNVFLLPGQRFNILILNIDNCYGSLTYMADGVELINEINGIIDQKTGQEK
ncbi:hypothetical protein [Robiginitalea sp. IMCC43444]|uniref:hypothetical protein n=1 Tax=Robiginitalea sp. IMCC43444 TaxID=3459121 RepID=UPI0040415F5B